MHSRQRLIETKGLNMAEGQKTFSWEKSADSVRLFLGGDVMTGRGVDQLFATHNEGDFNKPDAVSARQYLEWSALMHGAEIRPLRHDYIWGAALSVFDTVRPDFRLVNLETSITTCSAWERKRFNFRMHPANTGCLLAAELDCCSLANNHVLDFGVQGMRDTIAALDAAGIGHAGAGNDLDEAVRPYRTELPDGKRILVFSWGFPDSGCGFSHWQARSGNPGINLLPDYSERSVKAIAGAVRTYRRNGDLVVASLHWGWNRVQRVPDTHRAFARYLIDQAGVDVIHGHSAHHVLGAEVIKGRPVLYGCGDLINDYEGKAEYREYKGYLGALFFLDLDRETNRMMHLRIVPLQRRRFRLEAPSKEDAGSVLNAVRKLQ